MSSTVTRADLADACDLALAGHWQAAHAIAQKDETDRISCWLHAVLHKIEGDHSNSRYWYARAGQDFTAYAKSEDELRAIKAVLTY